MRSSTKPRKHKKSPIVGNRPIKSRRKKGRVSGAEIVAEIRPEVKLVTEVIDSYAVTVGFRKSKPYVCQVIHAKTTRQIDSKTRALQTSRSEAQILERDAGQAIADKLGIAYQEPRQTYRLNLNAKFRLEDGFNQTIRRSRPIKVSKLQTLAGKLNMRMAKK